MLVNTNVVAFELLNKPHTCLMLFTAKVDAQKCPNLSKTGGLSGPYVVIEWGIYI